LALVPPEDVVKFSAMTGQSLYYMGGDSLKHKVLAIVEEEGAARAGYALKLLQSEGELRIASTGKESTSGRMFTQEYRVEGPTSLFLTTTSITVDEELLNRCVILSVDEDRDQTRAIHQLQRQRQTLEGMVAAQAREQTVALHRNAQRLLRPVLVVNPFAERLTFADHQTRTRRDHAKYLTLIRAVAFLHQHQRPIRTAPVQGRTIEFIEVTVGGIERANNLAHEVLGRSRDELPPQTRRLLCSLDELVTAECRTKGLDRADYRFSRRAARDATGWGDTQLKIHLRRLVELEYLVVHRDRDAKRFLYELLSIALTATGGKVLAGLLDAEELRRDRSGPSEDRSVHGRGSVGLESGHGRDAETDANADGASPKPSLNGKVANHEQEA
ncbi:MAG: DNA primase, partial [Gemmataceae bacterium]